MQTEELISVEAIPTQLKLVLHNDHINSFERVVIVIIMVMGYDKVRAEQLATLAHYNGKATLLEGGDLNYLMFIQHVFAEENLKTTLE